MYKDAHSAEYFGEEVLNATRELTNHIWGYTKRERISGIEEWLTAVSAHYSMPKPEFKFIEGNEGARLYSISGGGITMSLVNEETGEQFNMIQMFKKFSLVTLLHEFRHTMQRSSIVDMPEGFDIEEDAREWSCSLYFNTDPERYMRAVTSGKLRYA